MSEPQYRQGYEDLALIDRQLQVSGVIHRESQECSIVVTTGRQGG